ncbi:Translation initiation factor IF-2, mitochondrial [Erysiphe neolycopersici]|uniref:Translation initiation factor IF-2, mitochondrial n=1 Tax=Erysiphe neolycopersici TaxID=212602 RepID=A0A420HQN2_9PEZI|nr:Translation initiation factor IF-2, mitochondrial [Erysiphe neolycopersici]
MKKCSLIKEAQNSILCIFCAHKLGQTSRIPYTQRRYFKSSHSALQKPVEPSDDPFASNDDYSGASWGITPDIHDKTNRISENSTEKGELNSQWGLADDAPSWATPFATEPDLKESPDLTASPLKSSGFTENPRSIRSVLKQDWQPEVRQLNLPPFPGPESSRAGRPTPISPTPMSRPIIRRVMQTKDEYPRLKNSEIRTRIKSSASERLEIHPDQRNLNETQTRESIIEQPWSLLKRRKDVPLSNIALANDQVPIIDRERKEREVKIQRLAVDREKREQEAELQQYTSPINSPANKKIYLRSSNVHEKTSNLKIKNLEPNTRSWPDSSDSTKITENGYIQDFHKTGMFKVKNTIHSEDSKWQQSDSSGLLEFVSQNRTEDEKSNLIKNHDQINSEMPQKYYEEKSSQQHLINISEEIFSKTHDTSKPIALEISGESIDQLTVKYSPAFPEAPMDSRSIVKSGATQLKGIVEEEDEGSVKSKRKKEKKKRGVESRKFYEDEKSKLAGKDRDRARRDARFARDQEEQEEERLRHVEKIERNRQKAEKKAAKKAAPTPILLPEFIAVANLATALKIRYEDLVTKMKELGFEDTHSDFILNSEISGLIAMEYNFEPIPDKTEDMDLKARHPHPNPSELPPRPPIVTIMGHVDHGKTTLLDYLRKSSVAANEHGGITQHIGAFSVRMPSGKMITFLDTPGHAAFLNMRQRGAFVTDIVILVVAADDGVKPQTLEAIKHAKAAKVPIIVAINKIDKPDVNIEKVKLELARHGVDIEDFGGDTQVVCVSGKTGKGIDKFEETAMALAEILDMRAEVDCPTEGWVLEASVKALGKVATILVRRGTLRPGQVIVAGTTWARVRVLRNEAGVEVPEAGPGIPVEVDGWRDQPIAGDEALQADDEVKAKRVIDYRIEKKERNKLAVDMEAINRAREELRQQKVMAKVALEVGEDEKNSEKSHDSTPAIPETKHKSEGPKPVYFIIKGDVSGSVEAVTDQIGLLKTKEVEAIILRSGVGKVTKFDIEHAAAAKGYVASFSLSVDADIYHLAEESKVKIFENNIIYSLVDSIRAELSNYLPPLISHVVLGEAEIAQVYMINFKGRKRDPIAGCKIRNGLIKKNGKVRVMRKGQKVFDGEISSLKTGKKDVQEVSKGNECGLAFAEAWTEFQIGDIIQQYEERREKRYL